MAYQISYDANIGLIPFSPATYYGILIGAENAIEGTYSFRFYEGYTAYIRFPFITPPTTPAVGMWLYFKAGWMFSANGGCEIRFVTTSGHYVSAYWNSVAHTWDIMVQGSIVATSADTGIDTAQFLNVRFYGTIDNAGDLAINLNGEEIITFSGDTLPDASDAEIEYVEVRMWSNQFNYQDLGNVSSISLNDGGADPGDRRVYVRMVNSDSSIQWTRSTGADSYALLDDVPPSADYVYTETNGHVDKLGLSDVSGIATFHGITKFVRAQKTTGDAQTLRNGVDSGGTINYTTHDLTLALVYLFHCMGVDPNTSVAWIEAGVNALLAYREAVIP